MNTDIAVIEKEWSYLNIYPYSNLNWQKYADRFGVVIPEVIIDYTMGKSVCNKCKQTYAGYQPKCTNMVWGYKSAYGEITHGHKMNGEIDQNASYYANDRKVYASGLYQCGGSLNWDLQREFSKQNEFFSSLEYMINALVSNSYHPSGFNLTPDYQEKMALYGKIVNLETECRMLRNALQEVVRRLNAGGSGLLGGINF